jgi:hypothetical protein
MRNSFRGSRGVSGRREPRVIATEQNNLRPKKKRMTGVRYDGAAKVAGYGLLKERQAHEEVS